MNVFKKHQFNIAKDTLRMTDGGAYVMGGMTKEEARVFLERTMKWSKERIKKFEE